MKMRHWVLAAALAQASAAQALGLGEVEVQSWLGDPLKADIPLVAPGPFDEQDIRVRIASPEVYERFGARYEPFHSQLQLQLQRHQGRLQALVTSSRGVQEPFLDIVVELSWPQGTSYRHYSLLLDPPAYAALRQQTLATRSAPLEPAALALTQTRVPDVLPAARPRPPASPPREPQHSTRHTPAPDSRPVAAVQAGQPYVVQSGDSLWRIARRLQRQGQGRVDDWMNRLLADNPAAFINGDPDRLKQGATLRLPVLTPAEPTPVVAAAPALNLAAELASAQQDQAAAVPETRAELRAAIARLEQEKQALQQFQNQVKAEMVTVLERRVAVSQALLGAERQVPAPATDTPAATTPAETLAPVAALEQAVTSAPATRLPAPAETAQLGGPALPTPAAPRLELSPDLTARTPVLPQALVSQPGTGLWYWLGLLPLGALTLALGLRTRRRQQLRQSEGVVQGDLYETVFGAQRDRSRADTPEQVEKALAQIREKATAGESAAAMPARLEPDYSASRDDLKQVIELYMLYSQYQKALNVILTEISKRPGRADLRLYLMRVYAAMGDWAAFDEQMAVLQRLGQVQLLEEAHRLCASRPDQPR